MVFKFPKEIKDVLKSLGDETRWKMLEFIINNNNKQSYTEIKHALKISDEKKGPFNYHLKELQKAGWLRRTLESEKDTERSKSYYAISKFGLKVIEGTLQAMNQETYTENILQNIKAESTENIWAPSTFQMIDLAPKNNMLNWDPIYISTKEAPQTEDELVDIGIPKDDIDRKIAERFSRFAEVESLKDEQASGILLSYTTEPITMNEIPLITKRRRRRADLI